MLNGTIDLHLHTTCSDGNDSPEDLVEAAVSAGYKTISITDHDTVIGVIRGIEAAKGLPIEIIPGIELSAIDYTDDVHILGYFIDYHDPEFLKRIDFFKEKRRERAEEIVYNLNRIGLDIQIDTVFRMAHGSPIGRPHIAEALLSEELITTYGEAFRYIGADGPAYVPKYTVEPAEAIELILKNGGIPVLAHPGIVDRDELIPEYKEYNLMGLEAIHPFHTLEKQIYYEQLAEKYGLLITGGSDWHGKGRSSNFKKMINSRRVPEKTITAMKAIIEDRNSRGNQVSR